jgi:ABC-type multidrug transport system fused ATPase/permease subunit
MLASPVKILNAFKGIHFDYLYRLFRFAFKRYPELYSAVIIYIFSVILEVLAMNAFIPLSEIAAGRSVSQNNVVIVILSVFALKQSSKFIFLAYTILFGLRVVAQIIAERILLDVAVNRMPSEIMTLSLNNVLHYYHINRIEEQSAGHLITMTNEEVHRAASIIATVVRFISTTVLIALYYSTIIIFSFSTGIGILVFLMISAFSTYSVFRTVHRLGILTTQSSRSVTSILVDALNGVRSVRAFGAENYVLAKFKQDVSLHKKRLFTIEFVGLFGRLFPILLLVVAFGFFILISTYISKTAFDYAFAVTLLIFLLRFFLAVGEAANVFLRVITDMKAAQDITSIIDTGTIQDQTQTFASFPEHLGTQIDRIDIQNLSFAYTPHNPVLSNLTVRFERSVVYAIVGESGAGKSTLLDIILRFQELQEGAVRLNNVSIDTIDVQELRKRVLLLGQETIIFNDTVRNNIMYGLESSNAALLAAAKIACIDDVIQAMPDGYDTLLQYRGTNLSGGQRQRIGLARAFIRKPDVLIMDESMSALDPTTKDTVIDNILAEYRDKIVIFVSHDPAIREKVDVVIELQKHTPALTHQDNLIALEMLYTENGDVS